MKLASILLGFGRHLRRTAVATFFDFSALNAICRWINDAIKNCPPNFKMLSAQVKALGDTVSLSSGLGMVEIWSNLLINRPLAAPNVKELEEYSSRLRGQMAPSQSIFFISTLH